MPTPRGRCHWPDQSGYLVSSNACALVAASATASAIMPTVTGGNFKVRAIASIVLRQSISSLPWDGSSRRPPSREVAGLPTTLPSHVAGSFRPLRLFLACQYFLSSCRCVITITYPLYLLI